VVGGVEEIEGEEEELVGHGIAMESASRVIWGDIGMIH
jgi:hypothetical protein